HFLCQGINENSAPGGVRAITDDFQSITAASHFSHHFERICSLDNPAFSNTFMTQLFGYMVEHFFNKDERITKQLKEDGDIALSLKYYFEYLLNDYQRESTFEKVEFLKVIMFTIAVHGRTVGQAVTLGRI